MSPELADLALDRIEEYLRRIEAQIAQLWQRLDALEREEEGDPQ